MFKYDAVVEEIKSEASAPSFDVIDIANPNSLVQPEDKESWIDACSWGTTCGGCSVTGTCTGGPSCVGCTNTGNNPQYYNEDTLTANDLLEAIVG